MQIKKLSMMLLGALSCAALLNGCGSSSKEGSPSTVALVDEGTCIVCHSSTTDPTTGTNIVSEYAASGHNPAVGYGSGCQGCHGGGAQHNGVGPIPYPDPFNVSVTDRNGNQVTTMCQTCHVNEGTGKDYEQPATLFAAGKADFKGSCAPCHTKNSATGDLTKLGDGSVHGVIPVATVLATRGCIDCHDVAAPQHMNQGKLEVNDNSGVRAVVGEFSKWSHHVTGVNLQNAHCAACHLEGTVSNGAIVVDATYHMADNFTHLRNADDDSDMQWDPASPNHTTMDNFCMSCHDANGATSPISSQIQSLINNKGFNATGKTASATNPFGDTISNRYDKLQRPAVVDAKDQFSTGNNSHHGVRGKRYTGRTRVAGTRQITSPTTFAANSSALLKGARSTIYDAGNLNALYSPLGTDGTDATGLGDDSTLHCGDCHTVGQWKAGSSDTANGSPTPVAIGAHGSNNEYLLRNTLGTDQRHTQNAYTIDANNVVTFTNPGGAFLVCYNCHTYTRYGSIYVGTGLNTAGTNVGVQPHAGEYDSVGRCNGIGNTIPFGGYTTGKATDGTQFYVRIFGQPGVNSPAATYAGEQPTDFGNIFGIQCLNCHNSGAGNAYGGIHGSANNTSWNNGTTTIAPNSTVTGGAYIDGMGNTTKVERFLPGLGNAMHVPGTLGGITGGTVVPASTAVTYAYTTGGISNDTNWEQKFWQQTATTNFDLTGKTAPVGASAGAGCYTLGTSTSVAANVTAGLRGPSVTGTGGAATSLNGTWGGCLDHSAAQGGGNHGFVKRIVRPVTY